MKTIWKTIRKYQLLLSLIIINVVLVIKHVSSYYFLELINSLSFQLLFGLAIMLLVFLLGRLWIGSMGMGISIFILVAQVPLSNGAITQTGNFKVMHFNVLKLNQDYSKIITLAQNGNADLLSFNEVTPDWQCQLQDHLNKQYPYSIIQLAENNSFGIAIFSKHPLQHAEIKYWGSPNIPSIVCQVKTPLKTIDVVAAHTIPPTRQVNLEIRNRHLQGISNYFASLNGSKILVGDLNTVSWSEVLNNLKVHAQLQDSRTTWQPTFPSNNWLMSIPIDHIFHSKDLRCVNFDVIEQTGSDHHGIEGEYII